MVYHQRGRAVYSNSLEVPLESADEAVLAAVERHVLRVEVLETALAKAMESLQPPGEILDGRERGLREELARLEAEVGRSAAAIAVGDLSALLALLREHERQRAYVRAELARIERERAATRNGFDAGRVLEALRGHLTDWQGMLRQETGPARQALASLLAGRLIFTPRERDGVRFYEFEGPGTVSKFIEGLAFPRGVVTRWRP